MIVADGLAHVRQRMATACSRANRPVEAIELVAVSKLQPPRLIREAYQAGQRIFGENYAQELRDKARELTDLGELQWHAIGPLQRNKAKYVAEHAAAFHALDSATIAEELDRRRRGPPLRCFIEVNMAAEPSKRGVLPGMVPALLAKVRPLQNLNVVGLMCLPPAAEDGEASRPYFQKLLQLARSLGLAELSMGTTFDFEVAIAEGATAVRVGTAIFGERDAT